MGVPQGAPKPDNLGVVLPNIARIRDYWLDGDHHDDTDREMAQRIELCGPHVPYLVRAQRALVRRQVGFLVEQGVTQFLDLGSGLPTGDYVHQVATAADPASRVVYVDIDPSIEADSLELIAGGGEHGVRGGGLPRRARRARPPRRERRTGLLAAVRGADDRTAAARARR
ncbi:SAM-dependent methyltransferase [Saccharomonospora piscinae]|uniref:SAM-dependent methyltransferase n=1 Tax=Saccharomonospora piscinae TaxID=687388 RepID=UPI0031343325